MQIVVRSANFLIASYFYYTCFHLHLVKNNFIYLYRFKSYIPLKHLKRCHEYRRGWATLAAEK